MTAEQVDLIRNSFDAMWPMRGDIAELCYRRFFELAPDARDLFPNDMERQRAKLMDMIAALVGSLDQRDLFQSLVTYSGREHARFGVQPSQYAALGEALLWSLECKFGTSFTRSCGSPGGRSTPRCRPRCCVRARRPSHSSSSSS
jgi:hemoglobin-like flavoprotein